MLSVQLNAKLNRHDYQPEFIYLKVGYLLVLRQVGKNKMSLKKHSILVGIQIYDLGWGNDDLAHVAWLLEYVGLGISQYISLLFSHFVRFPTLSRTIPALEHT